MRASQQGTPLPFSVEALLARDTSTSTRTRTSTRGQTADSAPAETGDTETTNLPDSTVDDDNIEKVNIMNASDLNLLCHKAGGGGSPLLAAGGRRGGAAAGQSALAQLPQPRHRDDHHQGGQVSRYNVDTM